MLNILNKKLVNLQSYMTITEDKYVVLSTTEHILNENVTTSQRWKGGDIRKWQTYHFASFDE